MKGTSFLIIEIYITLSSCLKFEGGKEPKIEDTSKVLVSFIFLNLLFELSFSKFPLRHNFTFHLLPIYYFCLSNIQAFIF